MPTYEQISNELLDIEARQREIAAVVSPSDAETKELWKLEGQADALRALKDEAHKVEVANASRIVTPSTVGKSFRDMPAGQEFEIRDALVEGSGSGSYLVPQEWHSQVEEFRFQANRLRGLGVQVIKTNSTHNIPILSALATAAVTGENVAYTASDPTVSQVILGAYKYTLKTAVSEELLADAAYPVDQMLARATGMAFGAAEEKDMLVGDGSSKITGIFNKTADLTTAGSGVFTKDELIGIVFGLAQQYHDGAVWMMNPATASAFAQLKEDVTSSGTTPYWWTNAAQGTPATFLGFPVLLNTNIAALAAGAKAVCFGNPKMYALGERGPLVAKRLQLTEYGDTFAFNQRLDGKPLDAAAFYVAAAKS